MSAPWQLVEVPVGGADVNTDPMRVEAPKVLVAENVALDVPRRARKRQGVRTRAQLVRMVVPLTTSIAMRTLDVRDARWIGTEVSGRILAHVDNVLLSESDGQWLVRGNIDQMRISAGRPQWDAFSSAGTPTVSDMGVAGDVMLMAWSRGSGLAVGLYDLATGAGITSVFRPTNGAHTLRIATIPELETAILFYDGGAGTIKAMPVVGPSARTTAPLASILQTQTVVSDAITGPAIFDVTTVGSRVVLAYVNNAGGIGRVLVDATGRPDTVQTDPHSGGAGTPTAIAVNYPDSAGRFVIAWGSDAGFLRARDYNVDTSLSAHAAITVIDTLTAYKAIALSVRGTIWTILYETGAAALHNRLISRATWDPGSASVPAGAANRLLHASLRSKMWKDAATDRWYVVVAYESQTQPSTQVTYFVYAVTTGDSGADPGAYEAFDFVLVGILWPGFAGGVLPLSSLASPVVTGRTVRMALTYRAKQTELTKLNSVRPVTIEHAPTDMQSVVNGPDGASYMPGGMLWRIDEALGHVNGPASSVSEAGFALSPENCTGTPAAGGALTVSASYTYKFFYRDYSTGERSSAFTFVFATGAAQGTMNLVIQTLSHSNRLNVVIDVVRTEANPTPSSPFYLVASLLNDITLNTVNYADTLSDAVLKTRERDYLTLGEVDEAAPPACEAIAMGQGRAALALADDDGTIWLSKQRGAAEPLRWSDILTIAADHPTPGRITALAWNGPELVVWRERGIQVLTGKGADNTGAGSTIEPARIVSHELGCSSARTLVRIPAGWVFQADDGTYWQLGTDGQLSYIGADVEPLRAPCLGAFAIFAEKKVEFVTATGSLVYYYDSGVWATSTIAGRSAASTPAGVGLYLPSSTSPLLLEDDLTGYRDNGVEYVQRIKMPWFRPAGVQGEIKVRRILIAGGFEGRHRPRARISYDFEPGHQETYEWQAEQVVASVVAGDGVSVFGGNTRLNVATQVYAYAIPVTRERCMAIGIELLDRAVGGTDYLGASFWVTAVGYEWAPAEVAGSAGYRYEERRLGEVV